MSEDENQNENPSDKTAPGTDFEKLESELEKAKKDYLYLMADFDNYRKNAIKERSDLSKYGIERFVREFLDVFDNFERALETAVSSDNIETFRKGVVMIATEIRTLLNRHGVEELKSEGPFDPSKHEALGSEPREDMPAGHVARTFKKAYKLHDKMIRPAQVTVSSAPPVKN